MISHKEKYLSYYLWLLQLLASLDYLISLNFLPETSVVKVVKYGLSIGMVFLVTSYSLSRRLPVKTSQLLWLLWIAFLMVSALPQVFSSPFYLKHYLQIDLALYTIPLLMIASPTLEFYKSLFTVSWVCVVLYVVASLFVFNSFPLKSEGLTYLIGGGLPLLLMTLPYHSKLKSRIIMVALLIVLFLMMVLSRRNKVVYFGGAMVFASFINFFSSLKKGRGRKLAYFILSLIVVIGFALLSDSFFADFSAKITTGMGSRETVIELFYDDFNRTPKDWIWGRGIFGQVEAGILGDETTGLRDGIENGYLSLILKGGWIWLSLLIITALSSIYKGFFHSNNLLCKGFAMIILLYFVDMIGFGIPGISLKYVMVYIAIAGCNTEWLRNCSDEFLAERIGL